MKSWTRTLNLHDAHELLALASTGMDYGDWATACHRAIPRLSAERRRELIRILRDQFMNWREHKLMESTFLSLYRGAPQPARRNLVTVRWALTHPLTLLATEELIPPALAAPSPAIPLAALDALVAANVKSTSAESLRKTRTTLLGAMEGVGTLITSGTGQHRALRAARGRPHPIAFAFVLLAEIEARGIDGMMMSEAIESSEAARLTQCGEDYAVACVDWAAAASIIVSRDDEVAVPVRPPG
jgi:hypothetical protein